MAGESGNEYTLSGWSFWEPNYPGGVEVLNEGTTWGAIPSDTETFYFIEFINESGDVIETAQLDLSTVQSNDRTWREHSLTAMAPEGTADVKVGVLAESLRSNREGDPFDDAYFDDFSLTVADAILAGDYNADGVVDAADYSVWRDNLGASEGTLVNDVSGGIIGTAQYDAWRSNYGATAAVSLAATSVPEPSAATILSLLLSSALVQRRRSTRRRGC